MILNDRPPPSPNRVAPRAPQGPAPAGPTVNYLPPGWAKSKHQSGPIGVDRSNVSAAFDNAGCGPKCEFSRRREEMERLADHGNEGNPVFGPYGSGARVPFLESPILRPGKVSITLRPGFSDKSIAIFSPPKLPPARYKSGDPDRREMAGFEVSPEDSRQPRQRHSASPAGRTTAI